MTFLQFILRDLIGEPDDTGQWACPWCGSPGSLFMRQNKRTGKRRVACLECPGRGDERDLIQKIKPSDSSTREARLRDLRRRFERDAGVLTVNEAVPDHGGSSSPKMGPGSGAGRTPAVPPGEIFGRICDGIVPMADDPHGLQFIERARFVLGVMAAAGVVPEEVLEQVTDDRDDHLGLLSDAGHAVFWLD